MNLTQDVPANKELTDAKQSTQVDFLPVIESDLNDYCTIFTTIKECIRLSGNKTCLDLPIWFKAVDIIQQAYLLIILR